MKLKGTLAMLLAASMVVMTVPVAAEETAVNYYGYEEDVTIKVGLSWDASFQFYNGDDAANNPWMNLYRENHIIPEILYDVDASQEATKLSTAIMSGNYPDVFAVDASEYEEMVNSGVIADIAPYFDEYASPQLKEYYNLDEGLALEASYIDGGLYGLPQVSSPYDTMKVMFIRADWLENLGLEVPTTMEELKEVARAFTYDDPDKNGTDDTYGLALDGVDVLTDSIGTVSAVFEGFGAYPSNLNFIEGSEGDIIWGGSLTEEMKAGLTLLQEMYADGTITKDFITMDAASIFEEAGSGRCGIFFAPMWGAMNPSFNAIAQDPNARFISAPVPDGTGSGESKAFYESSFSKIFVVSSQCENPEVLIKLMNLSADKLIYSETEEERATYIENEGGAYSIWKTSLCPIEAPLKNYDNHLKLSAAFESGDTSELNIEQQANYDQINYYLDALESGEYDTEDSTFQAGCGLWTVFANPEGSYATIHALKEADRFTYSAYNAVPTATMSEVQSTLNSMLIETIVKIITGDSVDSYDDFYSSWLALGGSDVVADAQEWADSAN